MTFTQRLLSIFFAECAWFRRWIGGTWVCATVGRHAHECTDQACTHCDGRVPSRPMWLHEDQVSFADVLEIVATESLPVTRVIRRW